MICDTKMMICDTQAMICDLDALAQLQNTAKLPRMDFAAFTYSQFLSRAPRYFETALWNHAPEGQ